MGWGARTTPTRARVRRLGLAAWWVALSCMLGSCDEGRTIIVDLRTDYTAGIDFEQVELRLGGEALSMSANPRANYTAGARIAEIPWNGEPEVRLEASLLGDDGRLATTRILLSVSASTVVTVVITRSCEGVLCDPDGPTPMCVGGTCEAATCTPETPAECARTRACTVDLDCAEGPACTLPRCSIDGDCFLIRDAACDADAGVIDAGGEDAGPQVDAGFDAGVADGGTDAGFDAGVDAGLRLVPPPLVLYRFDEGSGDVVSDSSGVTPALDLRRDAGTAFSWGPGYLELTGPVRFSSSTPADKIHSACIASEAITIETWVRSSTTMIIAGADPLRVVTLSIDSARRNFLLGPAASLQWAARLRTGSFSPNGFPNAVFGTVNTTETHHVVFVHRADESEVGYDNGVETALPVRGGNFADWDRSFALHIGDEASGSRAFLGRIEHLAIWCEPLTREVVMSRFAAGPL